MQEEKDDDQDEEPGTSGAIASGAFEPGNGADPLNSQQKGRADGQKSKKRKKKPGKKAKPEEATGHAADEEDLDKILKSLDINIVRSNAMHLQTSSIWLTKNVAVVEPMQLLLTSARLHVRLTGPTAELCVILCRHQQSSLRVTTGGTIESL